MQRMGIKQIIVFVLRPMKMGGGVSWRLTNSQPSRLWRDFLLCVGQVKEGIPERVTEFYLRSEVEQKA
jgi:hypothetical protein